MKHFLILLTVFFYMPLWAQNTDFIVAGDSWARLMCINQSFQKVFSQNKLKNTKITSCDLTSKFGGRAEGWFKYNESKTLRKVLKNPNVKVVYLSIGGNDFLRWWKKTMTHQEEMDLFLQTREATLKITESILKQRPDVKILVSGYDYGNFKDFSKSISGYVKLYKRMGEPTAGEIHSAIIRFSNVMADIHNGLDTFYIHHYGLAHYYYGNKFYGLLPKQTAHPDDISPPSNPMAYGGVVDYESPIEAMLRLFHLVDAYHASGEQYENIAKHSFNHYLKNWLK